MSSIPKTTEAWTIRGKNGLEDLNFNKEIPIPELSDYDVLVKLHYASLNYRDLVISKGLYPSYVSEGVVPGSDGSGEVIAVGSKVKRFQVGAKVLTLFNQGHLFGTISPAAKRTGLGGSIDGVLRQYAVFSEEGLVDMPPSLTFQEGATLSCAAVTAWNALYGLKPLAPGEVVLTQGTGGVSIFAIQFAKAAGATVIATTSSERKSEILKKLGADHVINYKATPEWGAIAKKLTPGELGAHHVIEVGGPSTMAQSLEAVKTDGIISLIGFLGGVDKKDEPSYLETLTRNCIVRGFVVGSRAQFEDMNRAIEANKIKPVINEKVFKLSELKEAYQYMWDQRHFGKLTISID